MGRASYSFFETLLVLQGEAQQAAWHLRRIEHTLSHHGGAPATLLREMEARLRNPFTAPENAMRLRLEYDAQGYTHELTPILVTPYSSLRPVTVQDLDYRFKRTDRQALLDARAQRGDADDALLVREGRIADTTIANLMLLRQGEWFTPIDSLLPGTKQARYIAEQGLTPRRVQLRELERYERIVAINALRDAEITRIG